MLNMIDVNKYKFVAAVTAIFLVPFLLLSRHFLYGNKELVKRDTLKYMELRTNTVANTAADMLALNYDISRTALSTEFMDASLEGRKKLLEKKIKENPSIYSEFSVLNAEGREILRTGADSPKKLRDYSGTEIFRRAASSREAAGAVEYGQYTPPVLVLAQPVAKNRGGKPGFFVLARMSLAYVGELVRVVGRNSAGDIGLIDAGGQMITDSLGRAVMTPGIKAPPEVLRTVNSAYAKSLRSARNEVSFRGRSYLVSVTAVGGTRWWIFEAVDAKRALDYTSLSWGRRMVWAGALLIVIFGFVSHHLAMTWLAAKQQ